METTGSVSGRDDFSALAAENSALRTQNHVLYNLLETCRDWLRIMNADPSKISKIEGTLKAARKIDPSSTVGVFGHGRQETRRASI